jgi:hypothetical protein
MSKWPSPLTLKLLWEMPQPHLWSSQLLARLVLSPLLSFFLLRWLFVLKLGVEHGEYDPDEAQGPDPCRQADPQDAVE